MGSVHNRAHEQRIIVNITINNTTYSISDEKVDAKFHNLISQITTYADKEGVAYNAVQVRAWAKSQGIQTGTRGRLHRSVVESYVAHGCPVDESITGGRIHVLNTKEEKVKTTKTKHVPDSVLIREWGKENGYTTADRGRLSNDLLIAYAQAYGFKDDRFIKSPSKKGKNRNAAKIRAWAKDNGYTVADTGRLRNQVILAYQSAHTKTKVKPFPVTPAPVITNADVVQSLLTAV